MAGRGDVGSNWSYFTRHSEEAKQTPQGDHAPRAFSFLLRLKTRLATRRSPFKARGRARAEWDVFKNHLSVSRDPCTVWERP